ncbi:pseudouridine synthase [Oceanibium sediminis]|uniref:pseudouridine synthase n=1 Tax=Oceanibium sediminis TaxID=2026339 RepID=UPI000DD3DCA1|nr:pseudouridine synthase [Oceanibium sediminis]
MTGLLPSGAPYLPPTDPLCVLHADDSLLLVDKPAGLLSVPGKADGLEDCLEARVKAAFPDALLLHRLDMDTSGVMVFARSRLAQRHLHKQFEGRVLEKSYLAMVWGTPGAERGRIDAPLICDWPRRPLQKICAETGKPSVTDWELAGQGPHGARLALTPLTGRSHQIRVHLLSIGHPILGDRFYAPKDALAAAPRLMLHAHRLRLRHPEGGAWVEYEAPAPF